MDRKTETSSSKAEVTMVVIDSSVAPVKAKPASTAFGNRCHCGAYLDNGVCHVPEHFQA